MSIRKNILGGALILLFASCARELIIDDLYQREVVLSGVFVADSTMKISLCYTQNLYDTISPIVVEGVVPNLYCNNQLIGEMESIGGGIYKINKKATSGNKYRVEVEVDGKMVIAETKVPEKPQVLNVDRDSVHYRFSRSDLQCFIKVNKKNVLENHLWFWHTGLKNEGSKVFYSIYSASPYFDNFMKASDQGCLRLYTYDFDRYVRIKHEISLSDTIAFDYIVGTGLTNHSIYVASFDSSYDQYLKSYLSFVDLSYLIDEFPVFIVPAFVHSNVENGTGILGSYALTKIEFNHSTVENVNQF